MRNFVEYIKKYWKEYLLGFMAIFILLIFLSIFLGNLGNFSKGLSSYDSMNSEMSQRTNYNGGSFAPNEVEREKIKKARISSETENFENDVNRINVLLTNYEGIVLEERIVKNSYTQIETYYGLTKIDSQRVDAFLVEIKGIGEVLNFEVGVQDVTGVYTDYTNRLERYNGQILKYEVMLDRDNLSIKDEIQIQERIDNLENQIFYLNSMVNNIEEKVEYSEVTITLKEKPSVFQKVEFISFKDGFSMFLESLKTGIEFILIVLGFIVPFIIIYLIYRIVKIPFKKRSK